MIEIALRTKPLYTQSALNFTAEKLTVDSKQGSGVRTNKRAMQTNKRGPHQLSSQIYTWMESYTARSDVNQVCLHPSLLNRTEPNCYTLQKNTRAQTRIPRHPTLPQVAGTRVDRTSKERTHALLGQLLPRFESHLASYSSRQLSSCLFNLGKAGYRPSHKFLDKLLAALTAERGAKLVNANEQVRDTPGHFCLSANAAGFGL